MGVVGGKIGHAKYIISEGYDKDHSDFSGGVLWGGGGGVKFLKMCMKT